MDKLDSTPARSPMAALARDRMGRAIKLPAEAFAWRVRRHTGGRPKQLLGADKQPMQFPLEYTLADVEDILVPGDYRLDAVDEQGRVLDATVPITVAGLRNADDSPDEDEAEDSRLPNSDNEVRLVLEANVRSTQMAFLHNQRSLEMGLRMAETLRDGVHVLADAQADWIKAISSARGFFRGAPALRAQTHDASSDNEDEENEASPTKPTNELAAIAEKVTPGLDLNAIVAQVVSQLVTRAMSGDLKVPGLGALLDWRKATPEAAGDPAPTKATHKRADTPNVSATPASGATDLDPVTVAHFMAIRAALEPHEVEVVTAIIKELSEPDRRVFMQEFKSLDVPTAVAKIRAQLTDLQRNRA